MKGKKSKFWSTELVSCFGFPKHYLDAGDMTRTKKLKLLGKAWCIHTLSALLRFLIIFFLREHNNNNYS